MHTLSIVLQVLGICWLVSAAYLAVVLTNDLRTQRHDERDIVERCAPYTARTGEQS